MRGQGGNQRLRWSVLLGLAVGLLAPAAATAASLHPKLVAKVGYGTSPIGFARTADGTLPRRFACL